jgi:hypothetical protein
MSVSPTSWSAFYVYRPDLRFARSTGLRTSRTTVGYVRTTPPYYPFRMEYTRGAIHLTSEVVMMIYEAEGK